jgi:hypothetical protein
LYLLASSTRLCVAVVALVPRISYHSIGLIYTSLTSAVSEEEKTEKKIDRNVT